MPLYGDPVKNFAKCTVSQGYDNVATSIVLTTGDGAKLPAPASEGAFNLVWWNSTDYNDPADDPNVEIVRCTARTTDTLTVTRGQESTAASSKNTAGKTYKMILALTKLQADERRPAFKVVTFTRDQSTASGTQAITGVGFKPRAVVLLAAVNATTAGSIGIDDGTSRCAIYDNTPAVANSYTVNTSNALLVFYAAGQYNTIYVQSFDTDGATFYWTKTGSPPSATITVAALFIR